MPAATDSHQTDKPLPAEPVITRHPITGARLPALLSIPDAVDACGVSRRTLYNWMNAGKVEFVYTAGGNRMIVTATLWRGTKD